MYCRLIANRIVLLLLIFATIGYWALSSYGAAIMKSRLDSQKILPKGSMMLKADKIRSSIVRKEYHPLTIIINKPVNFSNSREYGRLLDMVNDFETGKFMIGKASTNLWINHYKYGYVFDNSFKDTFCK